MKSFDKWREKYLPKESPIDYKAKYEALIEETWERTLKYEALVDKYCELLKEKHILLNMDKIIIPKEV